MDEFKKQLYKYAGQRLKRARMVKGLSQIELAQQLGYADSTTIYKIEKGLQRIPHAKMAELCQLLGIDYAYLTDGFDFMFDNDGHPVIIETRTVDTIREQLTTRAKEYLTAASNTQLEQIVGIMAVIIGGSNDGVGNMEQ